MLLEEVTESFDSVGGTAQVWSQITELYGAFQTRRGEEKLGGGRTTNIVSHVFYCQIPVNILGRHNLDIFHSKTEGITGKHKLRYGTRLFDIISVDGASWYFTLELVERA